MSELFIPRKFQDIVRFEAITDTQGKKIALGAYNPNTDTISLDPEHIAKSILCEELCHRKQHQFLVAQGLYPTSRIHNLFYTEAGEIGIRPTIRGIELRDNSLEMSGEVSANYIRYFENATNFAYLYDSLDSEVRDRFIGIVRGNKLFDGIQATLEYIEKGLTPNAFKFMATFADHWSEEEAWEKINEARKRW